MTAYSGIVNSGLGPMASGDSGLFQGDFVNQATVTREFDKMPPYLAVNFIIKT